MSTNTISVSYTYASHPFDRDDADVILLSSDSVRFLVYKNILSLASPVFSNLFGDGDARAEGQAYSEKGVPIIDVSEDSATLDAFLRLIYPVGPALMDVSELERLWEVSFKYETTLAMTKYVAQAAALHGFLDTKPLEMFAVACRFGLEQNARTAAQHAVGAIARGVSLPNYVAEMDHISAGAYFRLKKHLNCASTMSVTDAYWSTFSLVQRNPADGVIVSSTPSSANLSESVDPQVWLDAGLLVRNPADVTIRSSDGVDFPAHKLILSTMSPKLVAEATPPTSESELPVVAMSEPSYVVHTLLRVCYGFPLQLSTEGRHLEDWMMSQITDLVRAARKYETPRAVDQARVLLRSSLREDPFRAYFVAIALGFRDEAEAAAKLVAVNQVAEDALWGAYVPEMEDVGAKAYCNLLQYVVAVQAAARGVKDRFGLDQTFSLVKVYLPVVEREYSKMTVSKKAGKIPSLTSNERQQILNSSHDLEKGLQYDINRIPFVF
ncbi:hypothetical protein EUX98_g6641 [Antrodiella citrinella]|uniref:BTB domain-containing protein n=1 Tax=Antrodiella citrinella TaxID=2447956 RepID=A0A4S4MQJ7_9APHY|nr:hypothetical protein EUX98_g6641 [Antrodiella citrinella]